MSDGAATDAGVLSTIGWEVLSGIGFDAPNDEELCRSSAALGAVDVVTVSGPFAFRT